MWGRILLGLMAAVLVPPIAFEAAARVLPYPTLTTHGSQLSTLILDARGHPLAAFTDADGRWSTPRPQEGYGRWMAAAVVAIEDARFRSHGGVDWCAAASALWQDLIARRIVRGASTITMQLQRLRQPHRRTLWGKALEALRARQIELHQDKDQILDEWLERASFGGNVVGADAAAWHWFGVPPASLSLSQAALLAGIPQNPELLRPDRHCDRARGRRDQVLKRMHELGIIDTRQWTQAVAEPVMLRSRDLPTPADLGAWPVLADLAREHSGTVVSTLDAATQRQATTLMTSHLVSLSGTGIDAAAVAVLSLKDGAWRALVSVGGPPWFDLTRSPRSTGSTLKPFIYAEAFAHGIVTPSSLVRDDPSAWPGWAPVNYDHAWRGRCSAGEALRDSRNLPALHLLEQAGLARCAALMQGFGLHDMSTIAAHTGLSLAIGGAEADLRDLAAAYGGLSLGGRRLAPRLLATADPAVQGEDLIPPQACWAVLHCLAQPERTAAVCPDAVVLEPAWKTGTSSGHRDAWCVAVTPRYCVAVWLGTTRGPGSPELVGADLAAPLALQLLSLCDPGGPTWPAVDMGSAAPMRTAVLAATLVITRPASGIEILADPEAKADRSRLAMDCQGGGAGPRWWFIDGRPLAAVTVGESAWWTPVPGVHEVRVADQDGQAAVVKVVVR